MEWYVEIYGGISEGMRRKERDYNIIFIRTKRRIEMGLSHDYRKDESDSTQHGTSKATMNGNRIDGSIHISKFAVLPQTDRPPTKRGMERNRIYLTSGSLKALYQRVYIKNSTTILRLVECDVTNR